MALAGYMPPVVVEFLAEMGKFSAGMGEVKAEMSSLEAAQTKLAAVGKVAATGLAVGIAGVAYESIKLGMAFDQSMEVIHTQAGASQAEVDKLKGSVLALSGAVGIGPEELATGLYHIESTGMRGAAAMDVLTQAAKLAKIGMTDLDSVTYAMSGVMSIGMKDVANAADAISYLNATVGMGDMRMSQLTAAIGTGILPSFKSAGLGMKDFSAALATIADNSTPADEAATRLRMTISMMSAPSGAAADALKSIGLSSTALADDMRGPNGLLTAVMDLKHHLEATGLSATEQNAVIEKAFGGGKTSGSILTLLEETDRLKSKYDQLGTAASRAAATDDAWAQQQKQFSQQWSQFVATLEAVGVKIGNVLIPKLQSMFAWINQNGDKVKVLAAIIGGVLVVAIGAWTVAMIQAAIANVAATWEILLIIAAVAALAYGIYELVTHWSTVWNWIKKIAGDVWGWLVGAWHATIDWIVGAWDAAWGWIKGIALDVWGWLVGAWHSTVDALVTAAAWVRTKIIDPIVSWFEKYLIAPVKFYLAILVAGFKFAWGFMSVIIDDFKRRWNIFWAGIVVIATAAWSFLKSVFNAIVTYAIDPLIDAFNMAVDGWKISWNAIKDAAEYVYNNALKPMFDAIVKYAINPVIAAIHWLKDAWDWVWSGVTSAVQMAWNNVIKPTFEWIKTKAIDVIQAAISDLGASWNSMWDAVKGSISAAWNFIKPIFDKIAGAVNAVKGWIGSVFGGGGGSTSDPNKAGQNAAHSLGFADGGVVPGPKGAPLWAVVHGGEQILSNDQLASMGRGGALVSAGGGAVGPAGGGDNVVHQVIKLDSKTVWEGQLRLARRKGVSPADQYPSSTNGFN